MTNPRVAVLLFPYASPSAFTFVKKIIRVLVINSESLIFISGGIPESSQWPEQVRIEDIGIRLHYLSEIKPKWFSALFWLFRLVSVEIKQAWMILKLRKSYDILFCTLGNYYLLSILVARILGKKVVSGFFGNNALGVKISYNNFFLTTITSMLVRVTSFMSDKIIIESKPTNWTSKELRPYISKLVHGALYIDEIPELTITKPIQERELVVGFIGRLSPEKGIQEFIQALSILLQENENLNHNNWIRHIVFPCSVRNFKNYLL